MFQIIRVTECFRAISFESIQCAVVYFNSICSCSLAFTYEIRSLVDCVVFHYSNSISCSFRTFSFEYTVYNLFRQHKKDHFENCTYMSCFEGPTFSQQTISFAYYGNLNSLLVFHSDFRMESDQKFYFEYQQKSLIGSLRRLSQ